MVSESKTVAELLDQFSTGGLGKYKYLISNWEYFYPGQREKLLKDGPKKKIGHVFASVNIRMSISLLKDPLK